MTGSDEQRGDIVSVARELVTAVDAFDGLAELLRGVLPDLSEPSSEADFQAAVRTLGERLDDMAVHQLGMLVDAVWLYRKETGRGETTAPEPYPGSDHPPYVIPQPPIRSESRSGWDADGVRVILDVAGFLANAAGTAAIGAGVAATIHAIGNRWRKRKAAAHDAGSPLPVAAPLLANEAIDLAKAAACALPGVESCILLDAEPCEDGHWRIRLRTGHETLRVLVPPGSPEEAKILFEHG